MSKIGFSLSNAIGNRLFRSDNPSSSNLYLKKKKVAIRSLG